MHLSISISQGGWSQMLGTYLVFPPYPRDQLTVKFTGILHQVYRLVLEFCWIPASTPYSPSFNTIRVWESGTSKFQDGGKFCLVSCLNVSRVLSTRSSLFTKFLAGKIQYHYFDRLFLFNVLHFKLNVFKSEDLTGK